MIERQPVSSTTVASVGYDVSTATLEIEFVGGRVYQYFDVPQHVFEALMSAPSVGSYLNTEIRKVYRYAQA